METPSLFGSDEPAQIGRVDMAPGAVLLRGRALAAEAAVLRDLRKVLDQAPFRIMKTPGGRPLSVAMSNCGAAGWVTDRAGYRYSANDPMTGTPWPAIPESLRDLAEASAQEAGYSGFRPDACLINRYAPGAKMALHQDRDERDTDQPIVSVSLGLPALFQFGGAERRDPVTKYPLNHGDVVVWGGPSRLFFHGILPVKEGRHPRVGPVRLNLTFRAAL